MNGLMHCNICHGDGPHLCGGTPTACPPGGHYNANNPTIQGGGGVALYSFPCTHCWCKTVWVEYTEGQETSAMQKIKHEQCCNCDIKRKAY